MKRHYNLSDINAKKAKLDQSVKNTISRNSGTSTAGGSSHGGSGNAIGNNPFLERAVHPEKAILQFLLQARNEARQFIPLELRSQIGQITTPYCEVEARLGILNVQHALPKRRVTSTGAKKVNGIVVPAFDCTNKPVSMTSGVSRATYVKSTASGLSEVSPISQALGCNVVENLKKELVETEFVETVYTGYANEGRCCFPGEHNENSLEAVGKMESKKKLTTLDLTLPAANYDVRITLSSEKVMDNAVRGQPPPGWKSKRIKRRRSYTRQNKSIAWQIDVTEVTTQNAGSAHSTVDYEVEMELRDVTLLQLINTTDEGKVQKTCSDLAAQLFWILSQVNPLHDALDVEECLREHPNTRAVQIAIAQCAALRKFMDSVGRNSSGNSKLPPFESPIANHPTTTPHTSITKNTNFIGCMPVNFSRHNIDEIQRSPDNAYYLSEKTDGVRYLMVFTGDTVVLLNRKMEGKQIISLDSTTPCTSSDGGNQKKDPMSTILDLIQPGTVFDGEVVMNRKMNRKPRPIYIVFDVLCISPTQPVLHLPFEQRKKHLQQASFRTVTASKDMFADPRSFGSGTDSNVALPLVRKNFVKRTELDTLLQHVVQEKGMRIYRNGDLYNHLTDGIIFQPNLPYVCGTDTNLLKWKYIDTVTIDVELLSSSHNNIHGRNMNNSNGDGDDDEDETLYVGCLGEEQTRVDMTRYVKLPPSERMRLEGDRFFDPTSGRIAEVGFDPETGEWYYLKFRPDKVIPNHISTVLGTLLELAESLTTDELRFRMSVPAGQRDTYRKEIRGMFKGLLDHQRRKLRSIAAITTGSTSNSNTNNDK